MTHMTTPVSSSAISLLALMKLKGVGRLKALTIVDRPMDETGFESCREALMHRLAEAHVPHGGPGQISEAWMKSEEQLNRGEEFGVQVVSFHDEMYPARLRETPDPPAVLFVKGSVPALHAPKSLAVVGTREADVVRYGSGAEIGTHGRRSRIRDRERSRSGLRHPRA